MDTTKQFTAQDTVKLLGYVILFVALYFALIRIDTYLRYKAIDDCGKISRYEATEKNTHFSYPVLDIYSKCLADKGIKK